MGLELVIWSVKKRNTVSSSHKWSKIDFTDCLNGFEMKSLIRQIEFEVHGRFNLEPFSAQNALKISEILLAVLSKPQQHEIYTNSTDIHEHVPERDLLPVSFAMPFLHWSEHFPFPKDNKNTFRHNTKPNHKCCSRMRLNILGFLYLILFFQFLFFTTEKFVSRSFEKWYFDFLNNQQWQLCVAQFGKGGEWKQSSIEA